MENELYTSTRMLRKYTGITLGQLQSLSDINSDLHNSEAIPIYSLLRTLITILNESGLLVKRKSLDGENVGIELSIKRQNLIKLIIANQRQLGNLMPKPEMASRILTFIYSLKNIIANSIKISSVEIGLKTKIDQREIERWMVACYNEAVKHFESSANQLDWGDDGSVETLANRIDQVQELED